MREEWKGGEENRGEEKGGEGIKEELEWEDKRR